MKAVAAVIIFLIALIAGLYPFLKKWQTKTVNFPVGEALASGVFLGAGLIHMLTDATSDFISLHYSYPIASLIAGATFLIFLALEHLSREIAEHEGTQTTHFAIVAFIMLSIHSVFAGAAFGLSDQFSVALILLLAIVAHKWAASFALAVQINKSHLSIKTGIILFTIFAVMAPIGVLFGDYATLHNNSLPLLKPCFNAIAAGTFLYLGTLHGLSRSFMVEKCCDMKNFTFVIIGFTIMAIVAIWT